MVGLIARVHLKNVDLFKGSLSDQGTFTPVGAQGVVPRDPTVENHFPSRILQWNLHHICMDYKKSQFCKKNENVVPFQNGGQIADFYFASFRFWPKFEKPLSQRNFSMKFGSK